MGQVGLYNTISLYSRKDENERSKSNDPAGSCRTQSVVRAPAKREKY